jgi:mannitol/fructose-specific phosphotransferase system IIA component (Ntr-type)
MALICDILDARCILLDLDAGTSDDILRKLVDSLSETHPTQAPGAMLDQVLADHRFSTVCMGFGCAISHARCTRMEKTFIAAARLSPPLDLGADDGQPVSLFFMLVGPQSSPLFHIKVLSRISRLLHEPSFRTALLAAKDAEAFHRLICEKEE